MIEILIVTLLVLLMCGLSAIGGFFICSKVYCANPRDKPIREVPEPTKEQIEAAKAEKKELENFYSYCGKPQA